MGEMEGEQKEKKRKRQTRKSEGNGRIVGDGGDDLTRSHTFQFLELGSYECYLVVCLYVCRIDALQ